MSYDFEGVVHNGAAFLDQNCPGWADLMDPVNLDLEDPSVCVLGQLSKALIGDDSRRLLDEQDLFIKVNYWSFLDRWSKNQWQAMERFCPMAAPIIKKMKMSGQEAVDRGFNLPANMVVGVGDDRLSYWASLERAWLHAIAARQTNKENNHG